MSRHVYAVPQDWDVTDTTELAEGVMSVTCSDGSMHLVQSIGTIRDDE